MVDGGGIIWRKVCGLINVMVRVGRGSSWMCWRCRLRIEIMCSSITAIWVRKSGGGVLNPRSWIGDKSTMEMKVKITLGATIRKAASDEITNVAIEGIGRIGRIWD